MALAAGQKIGAYEIVAQLGAGGMGEVYRARDSQLKREVAIKVLPADVAADPDRLARFQREAEVLAALNHPNIAHVYGLAESALVMELVEGEDLSQRIACGAIPIDEALPIAKQIADALEAAHEQGIVHRDLKPANVKVRGDGTVKVLDFGLAKALDPGAGSREPGAGKDLANSPTITTPAMTMRGVILGTAAYMAPEQAKGKAVDKRADIWAFGVVLFEMLTGQRLFDGETISDTLAAVLTREPPWAALPRNTPASVRRLLRQCLERDPRQRLRDIGDARIDLHMLPAIDAAPPVPSRYRSPVVIAAVVIAIAMSGVAAWSWLRPAPTLARSTFVAATLAVDMPSLPTLSDRFAVAPDGSALVFVGPEDGGLFLRRPGELTATPIPGVPPNAFAPVFSPDSRWIAFSGVDALMKIPVTGGTPVTLARGDEYFVNLTWGPDDRIRYPSLANDSIRSVSANGGAVDSIDFGSKTWVNRAEWLPEGRLLVSITEGRVRRIAIREADGHLRPLVDGWDGRLVPTGHLLFARAEGAAWSLMAVRFDSRTASLAGDVTVLARDLAVQYATPIGVTAAGDLFYLTGAARSERRVATIDRSGAERDVAVPPGAWVRLSLPPDGTQLALGRWDDGRRSIWSLALATGALTRVTYSDDTFMPIWMPDGKRLLFTFFPIDRALTDTSMWAVAADGAGKLEPIGALRDTYPTGVSADGRTLFYRIEVDRVQSDIFQLALDAPGATPQPVLVTPASEDEARPSPDGRWLAYSTDASGRDEVRVMDLRDRTTSIQVSAQGGLPIRWSPNSQQLYYQDGNTIAVVDVGARGPNTASRRVAFRLPADVHGSPDVMPDGERAVVIRGGPIFQDLIVMQGALR